MSDPHSTPTPPMSWIAEIAADWTDPLGAVMDIACGSGRHGRLFLEKSDQVYFVDRNLSGVADLADHEGATRIEADLEGGDWPLAAYQVDIAIVTNYLWRPRFRDLLALIRPGGYLIYQTFAVGNEAFGKPSNPDFLLREGELKDLLTIGHPETSESQGTAEFALLDYFHGKVATPKPAMIQRAFARKTV